MVIFYLITNLVALIKIWTKHTWSITTRPHMLRIRLEVNSPGNSFGTESLLPPLVVSVFKLDKATRTTQAGWKLRPWIREASKVFIFVISMEANVSENRKRDKLYNDIATLFPNTYFINWKLVNHFKRGRSLTTLTRQGRYIYIDGTGNDNSMQIFS